MKKSKRNPNNERRELEDREKLQFLELQRAREHIVAQISFLTNDNGNDSPRRGGANDYSLSERKALLLSHSADRNLKSLKAYASDQPKSRSTKVGSIKFSKTANYIDQLRAKSSFYKTTVDMMPVMSTTGDYSISADNKSSTAISKTRGASTATAIRLPIFKLPSIDPTNVALVTSTIKQPRNHTSNAAVSIEPWHRFIPYKSLQGLRKALLRLIQLLQQQLEHQFKVQSTTHTQVHLHAGHSQLLMLQIGSDRDSWLSASLSEMAAVEQKLTDLVAQNANASVEQQTASWKQGLQSTGEWRGVAAVSSRLAALLLDGRTDGALSVFMAAAQGLPSSIISSQTSLPGGRLQRSGSVGSSLSLASSVTLSPHSLASADPSLLSAYTKNLRPTSSALPAVGAARPSSSASVTLFPPTHHPTKRGLTKLFPRPGEGNSDSQDPAANLTSELLGSLKRMESHTILVKKGIATAQELVNIRDPRARTMLFKLGVDRMRTALQVLVRADLRRGFSAWRWQLQGARQLLKTGLLLRLVAVRNLLTGLDQLLRRWLRTNWDIWKRTAQEEAHRLRKLRVLAAAIRLQGLGRGFLARRRVGLIRQRRKYQKMFDAVIKIQALLRGKRIRWRYLARVNEGRRRRAATRIQRVFRGRRGRKRVQRIRLRRRRETAARTIQRFARGRQARRRVVMIRKRREQQRYAVQLQRIARGFLGRKNIQTILLNKARFKYAVRIQSLVRGVIVRTNRVRNLREVSEYRAVRHRASVLIQSAYRGYRSRIVTRIKLFQLKKRRKTQARAATRINNLVRAFLSRALLRDLRKQRLDQWISSARNWQEMWSEDSQMWYYTNLQTEETLWEPSSDGYTKYDGMLVLASGQIIEDPAKKKKAATTTTRVNVFGDPIEEVVEEQEEPEPLTDKQLKRLCSECVLRVAIRQCVECGDRFCTKCYKATHATGSRRRHTYTAVGPLDCTECELLLAERFCVSCDESFCDGCWRKVHSRGKRLFHPFCEVSPEGRVDSRIFTMDGQQVSGYSATYPQERLEGDRQLRQAQAATVAVYEPPQEEQQLVAADEALPEWSEYFDDQGYSYWYNNYSGVSQYESPWG
mmetsp:Transcript_16245/g.22391  ORF Transcript_16245/g.22391 Transcript_16245/m.22391 type:complete len:1095 (-) Transcript_16245:171-3455(-)